MANNQAPSPDTARECGNVDLPTGCVLCGEQYGTLSKCARCQAIKYCSRECQQADWKDHKSECPNIIRIKGLGAKINYLPLSEMDTANSHIGGDARPQVGLASDIANSQAPSDMASTARPPPATNNAQGNEPSHKASFNSSTPRSSSPMLPCPPKNRACPALSADIEKGSKEIYDDEIQGIVNDVLSSGMFGQEQPDPGQKSEHDQPGQLTKSTRAPAPRKKRGSKFTQNQLDVMKHIGNKQNRDGAIKHSCEQHHIPAPDPTQNSDAKSIIKTPFGKFNRGTYPSNSVIADEISWAVVDKLKDHMPKIGSLAPSSSTAGKNWKNGAKCKGSHRCLNPIQQTQVDRVTKFILESIKRAKESKAADDVKMNAVDEAIQADVTTRIPGPGEVIQHSSDALDDGIPYSEKWLFKTIGNVAHRGVGLNSKEMYSRFRNGLLTMDTLVRRIGTDDFNMKDFDALAFETIEQLMYKAKIPADPFDSGEFKPLCGREDTDQLPARPLTSSANSEANKAQMWMFSDQNTVGIVPSMTFGKQTSAEMDDLLFKGRFTMDTLVKKMEEKEFQTIGNLIENAKDPHFPFSSGLLKDWETATALAPLKNASRQDATWMYSSDAPGGAPINIGTFTNGEMNEFFRTGRIKLGTKVRQVDDAEYQTIGQLIRKIDNAREPFNVCTLALHHSVPQKLDVPQSTTCLLTPASGSLPDKRKLVSKANESHPEKSSRLFDPDTKALGSEVSRLTHDPRLRQAFFDSIIRESGLPSWGDDGASTSTFGVKHSVIEKAIRDLEVAARDIEEVARPYIPSIPEIRKLIDKTRAHLGIPIPPSSAPVDPEEDQSCAAEEDVPEDAAETMREDMPEPVDNLAPAPAPAADPFRKPWRFDAEASASRQWVPDDGKMPRSRYEYVVPDLDKIYCRQARNLLPGGLPVNPEQQEPPKHSDCDCCCKDLPTAAELGYPEYGEVVLAVMSKLQGHFPWSNTYSEINYKGAMPKSLKEWMPSKCHNFSWQYYKQPAPGGPEPRINYFSKVGLSPKYIIATTASPPQRLRKRVSQPFTRLYDGRWLHNRPVRDVYTLLLSAYRLRQEDNFRYLGAHAVDPWTINPSPDLWGTVSSLEGFQIFLWYCRFRKGPPSLLPTWWDDDHHQACMQFAFCRRDWRDPRTLEYGKEATTTNYTHSGAMTMPLQLRVFAECVYGCSVGRQGWGVAAFVEKLLEEGSWDEVANTLDLFDQRFMEGDEEDGVKWHSQSKFQR